MKLSSMEVEILPILDGYAVMAIQFDVPYFHEDLRNEFWIFSWFSFVPAVFDAYQLLELMKFFGRSGKKVKKIFSVLFLLRHFSALSISSFSCWETENWEVTQ